MGKFPEFIALKLACKQLQMEIFLVASGERRFQRFSSR